MNVRTILRWTAWSVAASAAILLAGAFLDRPLAVFLSGIVMARTWEEGVMSWVAQK